MLLPEDLLTEHSIVADFRENLTDEDCGNEEVLGWFYQYYISEKKAQVDAREAAVPKEDIPAKTQLFTPHWIVRYLVENSLGRLWLLNRPHSKLREKMPYYIEGEVETDFLKISNPEDIRLLDPAGGSGHMLTYAFDLLYAIYEEEGYDAPEIPGLILRQNIYGVDICDRAVALAAFALCMKARAKDNRFFRRAVQPHLIASQEVRFEEGELREYIRALNLGDLFNQPMLKLLHQFEEAKNFGALIQPSLDEAGIAFARRAIEAKDLGGQLFLRETHAKVLRVLEQAEYLCQRYHVVVANPPYMGGKQMNPEVKAFAKDAFPNSCSDLFASFIERGFDLIRPGGLLAMVTMESWMFLSSYEAMRASLLRRATIIDMIHMPYLGRGGTSMGINFGTAAAIWHFAAAPTRKGHFQCIRYYECDEVGVPKQFPTHNERLTRASSADFEKIPANPIAYWCSGGIANVFGLEPPLGSRVKARQGLATGDNGIFARLWHEVSRLQLRLDCVSCEDSRTTAQKWFPYNKGGAFRKWFGNIVFVVNWKNDGSAIRSFRDNKGKLRSRPQNTDCYFQEGITWSDVTSGSLSCRYFPSGNIYDISGHSAFPNSETERLCVLGFMNTVFTRDVVEILNPTLHFQIGDFCRLPTPSRHINEQVASLVREAVSLAREDWNNFETAWDFRDLPLLRPGLKGATLAVSWQKWKTQCDAALRRMQQLETENNRHFIAAYGLQDELAPEVPEDQITLARADARADMAAFLFYAVGCMMGRYSLDQPGLILADAGATAQDYLARIPQPTFAPDADGIVPVLDGEWFQDDIVGRFREFLRVTYGEENLAENIAFIEASLGKLDAKTGKAKPTDLRTYFVRDFYKEHLKTYKKRPIYWMFSSPEGSFQALIYLHRYTRDTVNVLLNDYVREFIGKLEEKHRQHTAVTLNESARPGDRTKAAKELGKIAKMLKEIQTWERDILLPLAQQRIELDLDDGVKVNYLKFKGAVVNIPGLDKGEEE